MTLRAWIAAVILAATGCWRVGFEADDLGTAGWHDLPDTKLESVCPPDNFGGEPFEFAYYCQNVIRANNGGIADTRRNRLILWGGGGGYFGNELYALELAAEPPQLVRLNDPTVPTSFGTIDCPEDLPPGTGAQPNSREAHSSLTYVEHADRLFVAGGDLIERCSSQATWTLDLEVLPPVSA